ncbi:glycoside hydrolase family 15 protein [Actinoplanes philippinensis]|uniref:glycoside hydrolase family 15 protein n=1 Tax=Actinoplanes philippinensis TaxID=35752 RepID=UPI00340AA1CC
MDAALLLIPRVGFLPGDDPRVTGTVEAIRRELCQDGFVLRYRPEHDNVDGLPGTEGAFLACSFWLVDALHGAGRRDEAEQLFERLLALRNDVGLLAEEYDPATGRHLGNTPQAFSLVGLVNSARQLSAPPPVPAPTPVTSTPVAGDGCPVVVADRLVRLTTRLAAVTVRPPLEDRSR